MERRIKHLKRSTTAETVGWIGTASILASYMLLSVGVIKGDSYTYHLMVLIGSVGLAIITYRHQTFQPFVVNIVFCLFAVIALVRLFITA